MGHDDLQALAKYAFLIDSKAIDLFWKLDNELRKGTHLTTYRHQDLIEFIETNHNKITINNFYQDFFSVKLEERGNMSERYYYLDFIAKADKRNIVNRGFLESEHIFIGLLLYFLCFGEGYIECNSLDGIITLLNTDYSHNKTRIYNLLVNLKRETSNKTIFDEGEAKKVFTKALDEFDKLGWINLDKTNYSFEILPSILRLANLYAPDINNIETLLAIGNDHI